MVTTIKNEGAQDVPFVETPRPGAPAAPGTLGALADEADGLEGTAEEGGAVATSAPQVLTNAEACAGIFVTIRETACLLGGLESPRRTFPDDKAEELGKLWGAVCDAYGVNLQAGMGKYAPVFAAVVGTFSVLGRVIPEARAEIAVIDARKAAEEGAKPDKVTPSGPVPQAPPPPPTSTYQPGVIRPTFAQ